MSLEEIRKFLREHGLEAVPASAPPTGSLSDFMSWNGANAAPIQFQGGDFPQAITAILCDGFGASTANFSDAFVSVTTVELPNSNLTNLIIPSGTTTLVLDGASGLGALNCVFPAGLLNLSVATALYSALPALPAGLQTLNVDGSYLSALPDLSGTALTTLNAPNCGNFSEVGTLPATLTTINCNSTALTSAPDLPAPCVNIDLGNCSLTAAMVNTILAKLVANNQPNGNLILDGNDEAPVDDGLTDRDTLIARGWTVAAN